MFAEKHYAARKGRAWVLLRERRFFPMTSRKAEDNIMTKLRKTWIKTVALVGAACFTLGGCAESYKDKDGNSVLSSYVTKTTANINANPSAYFDKNVVQKLPENVSQNQDISVIITMDTGSVMDSYEKANTEKTLSEYVVSGEAKQVAAQVKRSQNEMIAKLR